ncbi:hypothetical protein SK128_015807 [Halocaridina rubra]|uniref:Uncharacterized protein n=1 Tax=Halocaridina rubra TaxID=373956 RepID=A0AAN8X5T5_HALRR
MMRLYISALRDETSSAATVAKCQLMVSRTVPVSRLWLYSLTNVNNPSAEALEACYHLLEGRHRKEATLSIAAMAGKAVQNSCLSESSRHCNFENPGCPSGTLANCKMGQAVQVVIKILASHLPRCLSRRGAKPDERLLLAIRGLGNIGSYGYNVESSLMACGGIEADETSRIAAVAAIRRGSCSMQIINWLKWQALNETEKSELRITTFQSLHHCSPEEAEAVAFLIIDKESDTQVKSYVSSYMHLGGKARDARQYSRHMVANFTSLLGLPETLLTTDVIFQNSFLPQSIGFNLSSDLLRHHGGSLQFGGRIESLEDVLQSVFGHGGSAGTPFADWLSLLLQKAQEIFRAASEDFVDKHKREKRSYSIEDVRNLLAKVKKDVSSELHGWMYAGVGGKDDFFSTFNVDPFAVDWEELFESWLEQFLESSHSFLMNSDVETTHGWCNIDDTVRTWSIFGTPISMHREEGGLFSAGANSHVSLFALITNPSSSTLNLGFSGSVGTYSVSRIQLSTSTGSIAAELSSMKTKAFDVTAVLRIQGSDNAELKIDLPQNSFQGEASQYVHSLHLPSSENNINNVVSNSEEMDNYEHANCVDIDNIDVYTSECMTLDPTDHLSFKSKRYCKTHFKGILGLSAHTKAQTMCSINAVAVKTVSYIKKSEESISGYSIGFSGKNPGINSLFLDVHIEAEGASTEQRAGIVFGLTYSPHFTIKVLLHSQQFSASGEVSVVNDPNLKRLEGHVSYGQAMYGFKGELLLVTDGGQVSIKPRLVVSYPGHLEDALLEGYIAHYSSDKVRSLTLDLYTEGTLKEYIDIAVKGTGEYKTPKGRAKIFALRNFHLSIPHFSLGLESIVSVKESSLEANIQGQPLCETE